MEATIRQKIEGNSGAGPCDAQAAPESSVYCSVGRGPGEPCRACDEPIARHEERVIYGADPNQVLQLYARCEQLW